MSCLSRALLRVARAARLWTGSGWRRLRSIAGREDDRGRACIQPVRGGDARTSLAVERHRKCSVVCTELDDQRVGSKLASVFDRSSEDFVEVRRAALGAKTDLRDLSIGTARRLVEEDGDAGARRLRHQRGPRANMRDMHGRTASSSSCDEEKRQQREQEQAAATASNMQAGHATLRLALMTPTGGRGARRSCAPSRSA
jgi:hypothetical protein